MPRRWRKISLFYELAFGGGLKWWRPNMRALEKLIHIGSPPLQSSTKGKLIEKRE
jgi:hypothetical protein